MQDSFDDKCTNNIVISKERNKKGAGVDARKKKKY